MEWFVLSDRVGRFPPIILAGLVVVASCASTPAPSTSSGEQALPVFDIVSLDPGDAAEPALAIGPDGTITIMAGAFEHATWAGFHTKLWANSNGVTETRGAFQTFDHPTDRAVPSRDSDVEVNSTGTLHATTKVRLYDASLEAPPPGAVPAWAISAIRCPDTASAGFDANDCSLQLIDEATTEVGGLDRPWILASGEDVWIAYHAASVIRVQHSPNDGLTWQMVGSLVPSDDASGRRLDNRQGPLALDPVTGDLAMIYITIDLLGLAANPGAGSEKVQVARSADNGATWASSVVHTGGPEERLSNAFASFAIDQVSGVWHASWSDGQSVFAARSTDGSAWSQPQAISTAPARFALMPWVAAALDVVDIAYYATDSLDGTDISNQWSVFLAQSHDEGLTYQQTIVNPEPHHLGVVCVDGADCPVESRLLLDLFEIAISPATAKSAIAYTDSTRGTTGSGDPLPSVVLALER